MIASVQSSKFEVRGSTVQPSPVQPLINVCMLCHRSIGPDHRPAGRFIPHGAVVSHGVCLDCAPGYCASQGLSKSDTDRILSSITTETKKRTTQHATV